jgi:predicted TPR repeat methyltransferase
MSKRKKKQRKSGKPARKPQGIDTLLAEASAHHRQGNLPDAKRLFEQALKLRPDWPPLLNALGTVLMDMGELQDAALRFEKASPETAPYPPALYNMARLHHISGNILSAMKFYRAVTAADPGMAMAWNNLGLLLQERGDAGQATECFEKALDSSPESAEVWNNLGLALEDLDRLSDAAEAFRRAVDLHSDHVSALFNLGALELRLGNRDEAARLLKRVLELDDRNESACYLLQGLGLLPAPDAAPVSHVKKVFDQCAEKFEKTLVEKLEYRTPAALFDLVKPCLKPDMAILDLGCGTGLGADFYRPYASMLAGMDASEKMLEVAGRKNIYDRLGCRDILSSWDIEEQRFDLIYSSDVFVYFGKLDFVFSEISRHLVPGGVVAFSVERLTSSPVPFLLQESGRFAHSSAYVLEQLEASGFRLFETGESVLRKEGGEDVQGLLVVAQKLS